MAAATDNAPAFPLFSLLSPELRNQIWNNTLPEPVGPALYFYRKGCWCPRRLSELEDGYDSQNDENNLNLEFHHDSLYDGRFEMPQFFVNREANSIALAWIREQSVKIRLHPRKDGQCPLFVRSHEPQQDALYIAHDKWDEFLCEVDDRQAQPDLIEKLVDIKPDLAHIAVPETLLRSEASSLFELFQYYFSLKSLLVVIDAQPDVQSTDIDVEVQPRWEFKSTLGDAVCWNPERGAFDESKDKPTYDEAFYRLMEEVKKGLGEGLAKNHIRSFEIRPVLAVRR